MRKICIILLCLSCRSDGKGLPQSEKRRHAKISTRSLDGETREHQSMREQSTKSLAAILLATEPSPMSAINGRQSMQSERMTAGRIARYIPGAQMNDESKTESEAKPTEELSKTESEAKPKIDYSNYFGDTKPPNQLTTFWGEFTSELGLSRRRLQDREEQEQAAAKARREEQFEKAKQRFREFTSGKGTDKDKADLGQALLGIGFIAFSVVLLVVIVQLVSSLD
mmetsp:Transcript_98073/g.154567  ORF Transcript_98073/g.154567 Transcript_98073/m.154567 type:complete len:225 (-) Transcript_98073:117-791(-)